MHKEQRRQLILKRKNFLPTLLLIVFIFFTILGIIYFFPPNNSFIISLFFILTFLLFLFIFSLAFGKTRNGLIVAVAINLFLVLRLFGVGNILNFLLLTSLALVAILYEKFKK